MAENDTARALEEPTARSRDPREMSYGRGRGNRPDPLAASDDLTQNELGLLHSQVPGHRWNGWGRMTGDEAYFAACSCGWRSTDTGDVSLMLRQVNDHLDAVRHARGWRLSARAPAREESWPEAGRDEIVQLHERARELRATARGEQTRLSRSLSNSTNLLSARAEQADRLVTELERGERAWTGRSGPSADIVQHKVERARELRRAIVSAAAALAVITEEIAVLHLGLEPGRDKGTDWIYGERLMQPIEAKPSSGKPHDR